MRKSLIATLSITALALLPIPAAQAEVDYGVYLYMSAPTVQGSPVTSDFTLESFDSYPSGACPMTLTIGTLTGNCAIFDANAYGGASSTSTAPTTGGVGTRYASTAGIQSTMTISLLKPAKYMGLWWSAGSPSNQIKFLSSGEEVASMSTAGLMSKLGNPTVTSVDGEQIYQTSGYFGNPVNSQAANEPFVYLDVYSVGGTSFDQIVLSGSGFEFDNLTVSDLVQKVDPSLVEVEFVPGLVPPTDVPAEEPTDEPTVEPTEEPTENVTDEVKRTDLADTGYDAVALSSWAFGLVGAGLVLMVLKSSRRRRKTSSN